tara:strand:- start:284 stop:1411 length:1128 start_codon:yes stop_codon:yes gene_type:complete
MTEMLENLRTNSFQLTNFLGSTVEFNLGKNKKYYFLSTARHKLGSYGRNPAKTGVMMVLDGRKLGQKYKGGPIDYWNNGDTATPYDHQESEDRIYHDKSTIPTASKYIKEMHVYLGESYKEEQGIDALRDVDRKNIREFIMLAKKKNIKYWIYSEKRSWLIQNKKNAINIDISALSVRDMVSSLEGDKSQARSITRSKMSKNRGSKYFGSFVQLYKLSVDQESKLSKEAADLKYEIKYNTNSYSDDVTSKLQNELHNSKKDFTGAADEMIAIMKKEKLASPKQFVMFLKNKWSPPTEAEIEYANSQAAKKIMIAFRDEIGSEADEIMYGLQTGHMDLLTVIGIVNEKVKMAGIRPTLKAAWKALLTWAMDKNNWK